MHLFLSVTKRMARLRRHRRYAVGSRRLEYSRLCRCARCLLWPAKLTTYSSGRATRAAEFGRYAA